MSKGIISFGLLKLRSSAQICGKMKLRGANSPRLKLSS
jgi:hypothetical protein